MFPIRDYFNEARKHEEVFRNILRSLREGEIDLESSLEEIFEEYSTGNRYGKWTILDFRVGPYEDSQAKIPKNEALFASEDIAMLSGSGSIAKYKVKPNNSVEFDSNISVWRS